MQLGGASVDDRPELLLAAAETVLKWAGGMSSSEKRNKAAIQWLKRCVELTEQVVAKIDAKGDDAAEAVVAAAVATDKNYDVDDIDAIICGVVLGFFLSHPHNATLPPRLQLLPPTSALTTTNLWLGVQRSVLSHPE